MNTSLVTTLNKHYIYFIKGNHLSFYIAIPYKEFNSTNISIELYKDYALLDPTKNDSVWIKDEIARIYKEVDNDNITLVIPVFYDDKLIQTDMTMDQNVFLELDANISSTINSSYQILTNSNIKVNSKIYLIDTGSFNNFTRWFLQRYNTRVEYKKIFDLQSNNINTMVGVNEGPVIPKPIDNVNMMPEQNMQMPINSQSPQVQPPVMKGIEIPNQNVNLNSNSNTNFELNSQNMVEPPTTTFTNNTPHNESVELPNANSAGFVSYLLLGIITVIVCLGILYIML